MSTLTINLSRAKQLYPTADPTFKKELENSFTKKALTAVEITDKVKTFEDACKILKLNPKNVLPYSPGTKDKDERATNAYRKLTIIIKALNEGWTPNWKNTNESKWHVWVNLENGFSLYDVGGCCTRSHVGSRLCLRTRELGEYLFNQFTAELKEFFI